MNSKRPTILIVDDEESIRLLLKHTLSLEGFDCLEAADGNQALERMKSEAVSLAILDIKMPGRSGMELLSEMRDRYPDAAVIMATANSDINIAVQCLKEGAFDYLIKPFRLEEVSLGVSRALEKRRLLLENRDYQQHLEERVREQAEKIRSSFFNAIAALAFALEAKDKYTSGHSQRVSEISVAIARKMGLPSDDVEKIRLAGLIHDIGKIGVKETILNKPGSLTEEEFRHVKYHSEIGERILAPVVDDGTMLRIVRHHHEHYDGTGYPDGLAGEQIPLGARILAVADAFDAMTSERPYRKAMDTVVACQELEKSKATQLDPGMADIYIEMKKTDSPASPASLP